MALKSHVVPSPPWVLPSLLPVPVPVYQLPWQPLSSPFGNVPFPQGHSLVLSPLPSTPMVVGHGNYSLTRAGSATLTAHARTERRLAGSLLAHDVVLTQGPLAGGIPGVLQGGVQHPAPLLLSAPPVSTILPTPAGVSIPADDWMWPWGLRPPPIPPVSPIMSGENRVPSPHWACGEGGLATSWPNASPDDICKSPSLYENFRYWQHFKVLLRRLFPLTPDVEAVSCFLVPVLRSLSQQQLSLSVEEGLRIGLQEWDRTSNYDRMAFYEVAEEFMAFEAAEEIENSRLQMTGELQGCPLPVPLGPDPPRPPVLQDVQQPVHDPRQTNSKEQAACPPAHKCQQSQETQVPGDIPDDAVKEYMEIMDWLEDHHLLATGEPEENQEEGQQQEEEEMYPDLDLLSYLDELCSQEDFISKVEAIINPQFLVEAESEDVEKDIILAVGQVLEDEHGFTPEQLVEKRLLGSKVQEGVYRPSSPTAPQPAALQDAERDDHEPKQRVSKEACTPPKASQVLKRCRAIDEDLPGSEVPPVLHRRQSPAPLGAFSHNALPQDLAPQCALGLRNTSPTPGLWDPASSLGEDEEDFSSLSFLLASPRQLLPWELSQTPGPDVGLQGPNGPAPQASPPQGGGLSPGLPLPARSKKRVRLGGSAPVGKRSRLGPSYEVSGGQDLAQGQVPLSGPQKRQCNKLGSQRWRKKH